MNKTLKLTAARRFDKTEKFNKQCITFQQPSISCSQLTTTKILLNSYKATACHFQRYCLHTIKALTKGLENHIHYLPKQSKLINQSKRHLSYLNYLTFSGLRLRRVVLPLCAFIVSSLVL